MKKLLFVLMLVLFTATSSFCTSFSGLKISGSCVRSLSPLMALGNSWTTGVGDDPWAGGYRYRLQALIGVGGCSEQLWVGTEYASDPTYQGYHMGFGGEDTTLVYEHFDNASSLEAWFSVPTTKNNVIIHMNGIIETSGAVGTFPAVVTEMSDWLDAVKAFDDLNGTTTNVLFSNVGPSNNNARDLKVVILNGLLKTMVREHTNKNIYWSDVYSALKPCFGVDDEAGVCNEIGGHPTSAGYVIIAETLYETMSANGLY